MIKIAVIVPYFNNSSTISPAIQSISRQCGLHSKFEIEVIIVDDGSHLPLEPRVICLPASLPTKILRKSNGGAASARNYGLKHTRNADFIAFLDADDSWDKNKTLLMLEVMKCQKLGLLGTFSNSHRFFKSLTDQAQPISFTQELLKNYFLTSSVLIDVKIVGCENIFFPESQTHAEEGDLFLRIVKATNSAVLPLALVNYSGGKKGYGVTGLSANLIKMQVGELTNLIRCFQRRDIRVVTLVLLIIYSNIKFLRRLLIQIISK